jgi:hypothetical protein
MNAATAQLERAMVARTITASALPLTDEQASQLVLGVMGFRELDRAQVELALSLIRATEAAHGICSPGHTSDAEPKLEIDVQEHVPVTLGGRSQLTMRLTDREHGARLTLECPTWFVLHQHQRPNPVGLIPDALSAVRKVCPGLEEHLQHVQPGSVESAERAINPIVTETRNLLEDALRAGDDFEQFRQRWLAWLAQSNPRR